MLDTIAQLFGRVTGMLKSVEWIGPLLVRICAGGTFAISGWGKVLEPPVEFFQQLGIPAPEFQAVFVAYNEFIFGMLILLGLATRLSAIPCSIIMIVAILTAQIENITGAETFFGSINALILTNELCYLTMFVWLFVSGPGAVSIDALIAKSIGKESDGSVAGAHPARS